MVAGTYDLSKTPWATDIGRTTVLNSASSAFNEGLLVGIVDLGANVLYVDLAYYVNLYTSSPSAYGFENATKAVCTSVDATDGIGIGAGKVNSVLCTTSTLLGGVDYNRYMFADGDEVVIDVRGREVAATVTKPPFVEVQVRQA
mgnify:CR=1 FL=1